MSSHGSPSPDISASGVQVENVTPTAMENASNEPNNCNSGTQGQPGGNITIPPVETEDSSAPLTPIGADDPMAGAELGYGFQHEIQELDGSNFDDAHYSILYRDACKREGGGVRPLRLLPLNASQHYLNIWRLTSTAVLKALR